MTLRRWILLSTLVLLAGGFAPDVFAQKLEGRVVEHTLDNGMKLILMERHAAPVVSAAIRFGVGSVDEEEGKTGLAHLYEHLAFRGTEVIGTLDYGREVMIRARLDSLEQWRDRRLDAGEAADSDAVRSLDREMERQRAALDTVLVVEELDRIYNLNGAVGLNASTTADFTTFTVDLPANRLSLWAVLESDRMAHAIPRDFDAERSIVSKERRSRIQDDPEAALYAELLKNAFRVHPYRRPVPGWEGELQAIDLEDAYDFYHTYYSPNNAVAAVVGDIDVDNVIAMAETTFGQVACRTLPCERSVPEEPEQREERTAVIERDAEPALFMAFHKPRITDPDDRVFEVLSEILTGGTRARLRQSLLVEKRMAMDASSWMGPGDRYSNLFILAVRPIWPHTCEDVEEVIWAELDRLAREPVAEEDLLRAKNRISADFLRKLENNRGMADQLTYYEMAAGSWRNLERRVSAIESVDAGEVLRCAARYFVRDNCTVARLVSTRGETRE